MIATEDDVIVLSSAQEPRGVCEVCGRPIPTGSGITGVFRGRIVRFRNRHCLDRFRADGHCRERLDTEDPPNGWFG